MNVVHLVIDPNAGDTLGQLPSAHPLWIIDSEANRQALKRSSTRDEPITWFASRTNGGPKDVFARIAESLDQHHNELAQVPPYDTLDVYGLPADADVLDSVRDLGFEIAQQERGFTRFVKAGAEKSVPR